MSALAGGNMHRVSAVIARSRRYRVHMFEFNHWRDWPIAQNSTTDLLIAGGIFAAVLTALLILRPLVRRYAGSMRKTERRELLEIPMQVLSRTTFLFLLAVSLYFGLRSLTLGDSLTRVLNSIITITAFI